MRSTMIFVLTVSLSLICFSPLLGESPAKLEAEIPFDFYCGSTLLPAGRYTVEPAERSYPFLFRLKGENGDMGSSFSLPASSNISDRSELVFNRYGEDKYFLKQIWLPGKVGREFLTSRSETEIVLTSWRLRQVTMKLKPVSIESDAAVR